MKALQLTLAALFVTLFTSLTLVESAHAQGAFAGGGGRSGGNKNAYRALEQDFVRYLRRMVPELRQRLPWLIGAEKSNRLIMELSRPSYSLVFTGDPEMNSLGKVDTAKKRILLSVEVYRDLRLKSDAVARQKDRSSALLFESVLKKEILHLYLRTVGVDDDYYRVSGKVFAP